MDCGIARRGTSHTPVLHWNLRSPCRRERPSVPVKATLQRDIAVCEHLVASDSLSCNSNEFGLLPNNPIVRILAFQILTRMVGSSRFSKVFFFLLVCQRVFPGSWIQDPQCIDSIAIAVPMMRRLCDSSENLKYLPEHGYTLLAIFDASSPAYQIS